MNQKLTRYEIDGATSPTLNVRACYDGEWVRWSEVVAAFEALRQESQREMDRKIRQLLHGDAVNG